MTARLLDKPVYYVVHQHNLAGYVMLALWTMPPQPDMETVTMIVRTSTTEPTAPTGRYVRFITPTPISLSTPLTRLHWVRGIA